MMKLEQLQHWLQQAGMEGHLVGDSQIVGTRLHTDTRSIQPGDVFLALKGDNFDANTMLFEAKGRGAVAAIAHGGLQECGLPGIEVPNTRLALGHIAAGWRGQFDLPLIAVTGSNGKTTVTQMIGSILRQYAGDAALVTQGNLNNEIGVPLTLLRLGAQHRIGVIELGMNHPGEIAYLASLVQAQIAVVNNAQREHQEFMQSVEAVAQENGAVLQHLQSNGVAVFPADDVYTSLWRDCAGVHEVQTFALSGAVRYADISAQANWLQGRWTVQVQSVRGAFAYQLHIAGRHNVKNSLAAVAACLGAGVDIPQIVEGLEQFQAVSGRSQAHVLRFGGLTMDLIDDSYNANPDSVCAAIDVLAELPGPHLLVLGDMGEVGDKGDEFHAEVGEYAAEKGIESLYCLGDLMRYGAAVFPGARHFANIDSLISACVRDAFEYRSILVKGSRFMGMERVVRALCATSQVGEAEHAA